MFTEADLEAARRMKFFREAGLPDDQLIEVTRVMSRSMATVASAVGTVFGDAFVEAGDNERDLALRYAEASQALVPMLGPVLEHALNIQQRALVRANAVDQDALPRGRSPRARRSPSASPTSSASRASAKTSRPPSSAPSPSASRSSRARSPNRRSASSRRSATR